MTRREPRALAAAVVFFTRLPLPALAPLTPQDEANAAAYWPLVGAAIGGCVAAAWWLAAQAFPAGIAAGLALAVGLLLTGALHEDGFSNVCDGFGGGGSRERVLAIMRDSRIGAYGTIGLVMLLGLKWRAMAALPAPLLPGALIAAHALSRFCILLIAAALPYARTGSRPAGRMAPRFDLRLAAAAGFALAPLLLLPARAAPLCLAAAALAGLFCALWFQRRLGGYTGDCLGAAQQVCEVCVLLAALAAG